MRALITGGAGFIGSHLCELLAANDYSVDVLDNLSSGLQANVRESDRVRLHFGSAGYAPIVQPLVNRADVVFHLAAIVGVRHVLAKPLETIRLNIDGTANVLNIARRRGTPVILASSSEVYGRSDARALNESDDLRIGPHGRWGYAAAKLVDEFLALAHYAECQLPVVVCRLFNTIGSRQTGKYGMVVPRFLDQAIANEPLTVYGDGEQQRSFTWVGDVVNAIFRLSLEPRAAGQVVNIGNPHSISILDLARTVIRLSHSESVITHLPRVAAYGCEFAEIQHRVPDLDKIRQLIGYKPTKDLDEILADMIADKTSALVR